jgi:hypothetical protein
MPGLLGLPVPTMPDPGGVRLQPKTSILRETLVSGVDRAEGFLDPLTACNWRSRGAEVRAAPTTRQRLLHTFDYWQS